MEQDLEGLKETKARSEAIAASLPCVCPHCSAPLILNGVVVTMRREMKQVSDVYACRECHYSMVWGWIEVNYAEKES